MRDRSKKLLCIVLAVFMIAVLTAGCSPQTEVTTAAPQTDAPVTPDTKTDEIIELRWLSAMIGEKTEAKWFANVVDGFNAEYEGRIRINVDGVAGEAVNEKLKTDAATGTMPDVFFLNADAARFNLIAQSGKAVDLTPYMEANPGLWDRIDKDSAAAYTDDQGNLLGMPYAKSYIGIYYNKALFEAAGLTAFPATWSEFFAACDALKANGVAPLALMTGENSWTTMLVLSHLIGTTEGGMDWLKYKPDEVNFNEPAFIEAVGKLQTILAEYATADAIGATYAVAANHFLNGKAAMIANGPWMAVDFSNTEIALEGLENDVVYVGAPGNGVIQTESISFGIGSSDPKKIEAAFEVLKYLARPEIYVEFLNLSGNSPCIEIDTSLLQLDPINTGFLSQALASETRYGIFVNCVKAAVIDGLGQLLPDLASGALTPETFAQKLQEISDNN